MNKEPNKSKEPNEGARVLSDAELEGIVGGGLDLGVIDLGVEEKASATMTEGVGEETTRYQGLIDKLERIMAMAEGN